MEQLEQLATKRLGRTFLYFDSIHSTNTYLKEQGAQLPDGTAVVAGHQYAGRGRQGKAWQSSEEALALSVLLKGVPPYLMQMLPILFGIGARRALSLLCGREILLKWPNDLLLGEKKIAGILCESAGFGEDVLAVCGIGVNLLQEPSFFAELPYGSSLWVECGVRVSPAVAGGAILTAFEQVLEEFAAGGFPLCGRSTPLVASTWAGRSGWSPRRGNRPALPMALGRMAVSWSKPRRESWQSAPARLRCGGYTGMSNRPILKTAHNIFSIPGLCPGISYFSGDI